MKPAVNFSNILHTFRFSIFALQIYTFSYSEHTDRQTDRQTYIQIDKQTFIFIIYIHVHVYYCYIYVFFLKRNSVYFIQKHNIGPHSFWPLTGQLFKQAFSKTFTLIRGAFILHLPWSSGCIDFHPTWLIHSVLTSFWRGLKYFLFL